MVEHSRHRFENLLQSQWPPVRWQRHGILIAVSGGADSVALLQCLNSIAKSVNKELIHVAHFNHRWRGIESDNDQIFVQELAKQLELPIKTAFSERPTAASNSGQGAEAIARKERYAFLQESAREIGARYIVTGHTFDDQIETILQRIFRGTGISGLTGIRKVRKIGECISLIRPMLTIDRQCVLEYLAELKQPYRTDLSNTDTRFTRNKIRAEILPILKQTFGEHVSTNIAKLARQAEDIQRWIDQQVAFSFDEAVTMRGSIVEIDVSKLKPNAIHHNRELFKHVWLQCQWPLRDMTFEKWDELARLIDQPAMPATTFPGNVFVKLTDNQLILKREHS